VIARERTAPQELDHGCEVANRLIRLQGKGPVIRRSNVGRLNANQGGTGAVPVLALAGAGNRFIATAVAPVSVSRLLFYRCCCLSHCPVRAAAAWTACGRLLLTGRSSRPPDSAWADDAHHQDVATGLGIEQQGGVEDQAP